MKNDVEKIFGISWKRYKKNFFTLFGAVLLIFAAIFITFGVFFIPFIASVLSLKSVTFFVPFVLLGGVITIFLAMVLDFGFMFMLTKLLKNKRISISDVLEGAKIFWKRAIGYSILSGAIFGSLIVSIIYSFFSFPLASIFLIPFALVLYFLLFFWSASIVFYDKGVLEGMKLSYKKVKNNPLDTFIVVLILFVISLAAGFLQIFLPIVPIILFLPYRGLVVLEACRKFK